MNKQKFGKRVTLGWLFLLLATSAFGQLLTGMTPASKTLPPGWTLLAQENFENGSCAPGSFCGGNFVTTQFHPDGVSTDTHSLSCLIGNGSGDCANSVFGWNKFLPVGTKHVVISFYEYLDPSFRMNDEMFEMRFHWDTGNGQPAFREAILDYFQDSTGTYNSTDATELWNNQGQPYYQNKLPTNTAGDQTNFNIATGLWGQWEIDATFSTVAPTVSVPGTVTLNTTAQTYTCSTCNWISLGVNVGDSPHFTGFSNGANNGDGSAGGGGYSYFVTSVTPSVMTVTSMPYATNEGPVSGATLQIDRADGQYKLFRNGVLVAQQANMVLPGKYDFSTSNTTLSIGESYSKLIWRGHISTSNPNCVGDCQVDGCERMGPPYGNGTGTFVGACQSVIGAGGCGFEFLPFGWNGSGMTRTSSTGGFTVPVDCSTAAGGPMPNPPSFNRYIDDILVMSTTSSNPVIPAATITASSDSVAHYQTVTFPGFAQFKVGDGLLGCALPSCTSAQGLIRYWDLKNDVTAQWPFGGADTGLFEHQWGIKNQDGTTRYNEIKEGPMAITVSESNNVRVKLTQTGPVRSVGNLSNTPDCCMTMTKTYVFYRDGAIGSSVGASKVYTRTTINYNGTDGQAPLTTVGTGTGINYYNKLGWWLISGETNNQSNPCPSPGSLGTFTLSPWNIIYPGTQGTNANKDYILYAPVNANDTNAAEFLPANPCTSPAGINPGPENTVSGQPQPGTIMLCNGATSTACTSQSASPAVVRTNFLQIEAGAAVQLHVYRDAELLPRWPANLLLSGESDIPGEYSALMDLGRISR
jgi:hypothetical protein